MEARDSGSEESQRVVPLSLRFLLLTLRVNLLDDVWSCAWGQREWIRKASEDSFPFLLSIMALLFPLYSFQFLTKIWKRYQNADNIINTSVAIAWLYISYFLPCEFLILLFYRHRWPFFPSMTWVPDILKLC